MEGHFLDCVKSEALDFQCFWYNTSEKVSIHESQPDNLALVADSLSKTNIVIKVAFEVPHKSMQS